MSGAFYNEIDPYATQWLRNLIAAGHIAPGDVCETPIQDLDASDIRGYTQYHFFAGIGVWSYALRLVGWPDDQPVWTGSCPCQPFSVAGKQEGFDDDRHLFPAWYRLIEELEPAIVVGEQVASPAGRAWLDHVFAQMEALDFAVGASDLSAASIGAPHIRQRLYFGAARLADGGQPRLQRHAGDGGRSDEPRRLEASASRPAAASGVHTWLEHTYGQRHARGSIQLRQRTQRPGVSEARGEREGIGPAEPRVVGFDERIEHVPEGESDESRSGEVECVPFVPEGDVVPTAFEVRGVDSRATGGFWSGPRWLLGRDGGIRPIQSGPLEVVDGASEGVGRRRSVTFPLAVGEHSRKGRIKGYGNAIVPQVAAEFLSAFVEALEDVA